MEPSTTPTVFSTAAAQQAGAELAGVYAVRRTLTNSTCTGNQPGSVNSSIWLLDWSAGNYAMTALGPTSFTTFRGNGQGGQLTLTSTNRTGDTMTLQLRPGANGALAGTETVSVLSQRCSIVRAVDARPINGL